jgi:hypothetical protein
MEGGAVAAINGRRAGRAGRLKPRLGGLAAAKPDCAGYGTRLLPHGAGTVHPRHGTHRRRESAQADFVA